MANKLPKKPEEKPQKSDSAQPEANPSTIQEAENAEKQKSPSDEKPKISEIASKALPNIEPHVYIPETPATATPQTSPKTLETPAENSVPEQKPSPLEEDSIVAGEPLFEPEEKSRKKLYIIGAVITVIVVAISVWFFMNFNKNKNTEEKKPEITKSQQISAPEVTAEKEPETSFDRSKITLEILNGSGVAGAAKKIADSIAALEYRIIKVGNAEENSDTTQILVSKDLEKFQDEFLKDLEGVIPEATVSGALEDSTASARIIIGKN